MRKAQVSAISTQYYKSRDALRRKRAVPLSAFWQTLSGSARGKDHIFLLFTHLSQKIAIISATCVIKACFVNLTFDFVPQAVTYEGLFDC